MPTDNKDRLQSAPAYTYDGQPGIMLLLPGNASKVLMYLNGLP